MQKEVCDRHLDQEVVQSACAAAMLVLNSGQQGKQEVPKVSFKGDRGDVLHLQKVKLIMPPKVCFFLNHRVLSRR